jgi:deazaflavin-dependent oxidoreductase (nitroreductase family)
MSTSASLPASVPRYVSLLSPVLRSLLLRGLPVGPNALVTIRGRTSGQPRTTPLAIIERDGRRWVWSPWGETQWVRNLRAAGSATVSRRGREEEVRATELDPVARVRFFGEVLGPVARSMRGGVTFVRAVDQVDLDDPVEAARGRVVFELHRDG